MTAEQGHDRAGAPYRTAATACAEGCDGEVTHRCGYCERPLCDQHALDTAALRRLGWSLLPATERLCGACHGEQYWQRQEQRLLLWGSLLVLGAALGVGLLPLPGWLRYGVTLTCGLSLIGALLWAHRRKSRYLDQRVRPSPPPAPPPEAPASNAPR